MFKQTVFLVFCLFVFSRRVASDDGPYQQTIDALIGREFERAAIIGLDGSTYATSPEFDISLDEGKALAVVFDYPPDAYDGAIQISGINYIDIKGDPTSIYGKKEVEGEEEESGGVICFKTKTLIVIGVYDSRLTPEMATQMVETEGHSFMENGY